MEQEIRPLTREEQLIYLIAFLETQINNLQTDLEQAKYELAQIKNNNLTLSR